MFLFFAFTGTAVATIAPGDGSTGFNISVQTYIALCFGFSLMVNVWVFYRISGGLFNPAVSIDTAPLSPWSSLGVFMSFTLADVSPTTGHNRSHWPSF